MFFISTGPRALKQNPSKPEPGNTAKDKTGQSKTKDPN